MLHLRFQYAAVAKAGDCVDACLSSMTLFDTSVAGPTLIQPIVVLPNGE
jgi:hypothetical protein